MIGEEILWSWELGFGFWILFVRRMLDMSERGDECWMVLRSGVKTVDHCRWWSGVDIGWMLVGMKTYT